ncbi:DUF3800 domain-containing protein [uncultured Aquimarina sp.]|uniref:DUF3800 domain-containing protein n=1 Tax=uncultured Aquimarina sp. TaxID=575652 RepID=UPI002601CB9B|nr:DUF3800 domain-containing protein [uncultured Aquimarina sp.]
MANTIYFDESGNTGQDMLNEDQKVFVLASVNFNLEQQNTLTSIFDLGHEIHFKNLKNSNAGRRKILEFINHPLIVEQRVCAYVVDKEFNVAGQITNHLIETVMYNNGYDLYKNGRNIAYANWIYTFGNHIWDKVLYKKFINEFVSMIRLKSEESINIFYITAQELLEKVKEKNVLQPIVDSRKHIKEIMTSIDKYSIDVTFSTFLVLCDVWYKSLKMKLDVRFDESKQIRHYDDYLNHSIVLAAENPKLKEIGYDIRKMTYPPQINSLELIDSKNDFGVQCADLIASAIAFMYNNENGRYAPFSKLIQQSKLLDLSNFHTIWPTSDVSPEALGMTSNDGINPLDFLVDNMRDAINKQEE